MNPKVKEVLSDPKVRSILFIIFLVAAVCVCVSSCGCSSYNAQLQKIPYAEFDSFEWHRGGNVTSADIIATDARLVDGKLSIKSITITENWGPCFTLNVSLKGYRRDIASADSVRMAMGMAITQKKVDEEVDEEVNREVEGEE